MDFRVALVGLGMLIIGSLIAGLLVAYLAMPPTIISRWFKNRSPAVKLLARMVFLLLGASGFAIAGYWSLSIP